MAKPTPKKTIPERARRPLRIMLRIVTGDFAGAHDEIDQALVLERDDEAELPQRAFVLWQKVSALALADFFDRTVLTSDLKDAEIAREAHGFHQEFLPDERRLDFEASDLARPLEIASYRKLRTAFPDFLKKCDPERVFPIDDDLRALDQAFERAWDQVWMENFAWLQPLEAFHTGAHGEAARQRAQWAAHDDWLRRRFEREAIWGQTDTSVTLADVFVPPRAFLRVPKQGEEGEVAPIGARDRDERRAYKATLVDLHTDVRHWLDAADRRDTQRVVGGTPGCGKSSFARALAVALADDPEWRVLLVEVQGLGRVTNLESEIGDRLKSRIGTGFRDNPLTWMPYADDRKLLLILDGLDEIARPGEDDAKLMTDLMRGVDRLLNDKNDRALRVKALLLGRPQSAAAALENAALGAERLWTVAHMPPITHDDARVADDDFHDPDSLTGSDQREIYWQKWCAAANDHRGAACPLTHEAFGALTAEPILIYLLIISGYLDPGADLAEVAENQNRLYARILRRIRPRDWGEPEGHPATHGLDEQDFFFLLECLGLAAWSGGGRVGDRAQYDRLRDHCAQVQRREAYGKLPAAALDNVAMSFFTRDDGGYEFVHKSFADYLTARGLLRFAAERLGQIADVSGHQAALAAWLELAGLKSITDGIVFYLRNEARLLSTEDRVALKPNLERLLSLAIHEGIAGGMDGANTWREAEHRRALAEIALLAVLNALFLATDHSNRLVGDVRLDWRGYHGAARSMLLRWEVLTVEEGIVHPSLLAGIDFRPSNDGEHESPYLGFMILESADLRHCDLTGARLFGTFMFNADASNARLIGARLDEAETHGAVFEACDLKGASLRSARATYCSFEGANLGDADFQDADLRRAKLKSADIGGTRMPADWRKKANLGAGKPKGRPKLVK